MTTRNGDWFQTFTGRKFYVFDPRIDDIDLEDIAHSLANTCRFNGHTWSFYSVAQHSIHACNVFGDLVEGTEFEYNHRAYLCALLHDATEAYVGDLIRPIKRSLPDYKVAERNIWTCILKKFGLWETWHLQGTRDRTLFVSNLVKQADDIMLATERRDLLVKKGPDDEPLVWRVEVQVEPTAMRVAPRAPGLSKAIFLKLFEELQSRIGEEDANTGNSGEKGGGDVPEVGQDPPEVP
jgi:5'-deoxynucleotidase YfbR-like HD superfamily hydrolase